MTAFDAWRAMYPGAYEQDCRPEVAIALVPNLSPATRPYRVALIEELLAQSQHRGIIDLDGRDGERFATKTTRWHSNLLSDAEFMYCAYMAALAIRTGRAAQGQPAYKISNWGIVYGHMGYGDVSRVIVVVGGPSSADDIEAARTELNALGSGNVDAVGADLVGVCECCALVRKGGRASTYIQRELRKLDKTSPPPPKRESTSQPDDRPTKIARRNPRRACRK